MLDIAYENMLALLLVFIRIGGALFTNPILSRRAVPMTLRVALVLIIALLAYPTIDASVIDPSNDMQYVIILFKELLIGIFFTLIFSLFYYMLYFAGDFMDVLFGLSMAKSFDPATNIQASVSSQYINLFFSLYFFATNSHLTLIDLTVRSYEFLPMGVDLDIQMAPFLFSTFIAVTELVFRLVMPFLVSIMLLEVLLGILMKLVPQMHLMVINIHMKILLGMVLLVMMAGPISVFVDNYLSTTMDTIYAGIIEIS